MKTKDWFSLNFNMSQRHKRKWENHPIKTRNVQRVYFYFSLARIRFTSYRDTLLTPDRLLTLTPIGEAGVRSRSGKWRTIIKYSELSKLVLISFYFLNLDTLAMIWLQDYLQGFMQIWDTHIHSKVCVHVSRSLGVPTLENIESHRISCRHGLLWGGLYHQ